MWEVVPHRPAHACLLPRKRTEATRQRSCSSWALGCFPVQALRQCVLGSALLSSSHPTSALKLGESSCACSCLETEEAENYWGIRRVCVLFCPSCLLRWVSLHSARESRCLLTYPAWHYSSVLALNEKPKFLLKGVGPGSEEVPPPSAFWLWWRGAFNLIYLFSFIQNKTIFSTLKKKKPNVLCLSKAALYPRLHFRT